MARSMGPVAALVERSGGSAARVFRQAELPLRLIEEPDQLMLLRDQLTLLECASREVGDETLAARLSTEAGFPGLGPYGQRAMRMPRLDRAVACASETVGMLLQSATQFTLRRSGEYLKWTYRVTETIHVGRQRNEMLAVGYMLDLFRRFCGPRWTPPYVEVSGPPLAARSRVEMVLGCETRRGDGASVVFPAGLLEQPNLRDVRAEELDRVELPEPNDVVACIEHLIGLSLLEERPSLDWICRRLGLSRRSLQRHLAARGTRFESVLQNALTARAADLLSSGARATEVALDLGYDDPAHFTRAFRRWTGRTPTEWQRRFGKQGRG